VQVVRQHDARIDLERASSARVAQHRGQEMDVFGKRFCTAIPKRHSEEECPSRNPRASIMHHRFILSRIPLRFIRATLLRSFEPSQAGTYFGLPKEGLLMVFVGLDQTAVPN
jgi:hypothetical protein